MCWGDNNYGQLGNGNNIDNATATKVVGISDAAYVEAGVGNTCVIHKDKTVSCWGTNVWGQLGDGTNKDSNIPVKNPYLRGVLDISLSGYSYSNGSGGSDVKGWGCALLEDKTVECWGKNNGELGNGGKGVSTSSQYEDTYKRSYSPHKVLGLNNAISISTLPTMNSGNSSHAIGSSCAILDNGSISCWGNIEVDGSMVNAKTPIQVPSWENMVKIANFSGSYCTLSTDKNLKCSQPSTHFLGSSYIDQLSGIVDFTLGGGVTVVFFLKTKQLNAGVVIMRGSFALGGAQVVH